MSDSSFSADSRAMLLMAVAAMCWGMYWVPIELLAALGAAGNWSALLLAVAGLLASAALCLLPEFRGVPLRTPIRLTPVQWLGAMAVGSAFTLYAVAIGYSDVIRAVLLFYLAPAWSILIECLFLGRRWSWHSAVALCLSFLGMFVIFRGELPLSGLGALGDWLAVLAGLSWAVGVALLFSGKRPPLHHMCFASMLGALLIAVLALICLPDAINRWEAGSISEYVSLALAVLALGFLYIGPVMLITLWGAIQLPPSTVSFLLTLEVISGVASSALFLDAPFGLVEMTGTALILLAALFEIIRYRRLSQVPVS